MDEEKKTRFPVAAEDWDWSVKTRFLKGFEAYVGKVPLAVRPQIFAMCAEIIGAESPVPFVPVTGVNKLGEAS